MLKASFAALLSVVVAAIGGCSAGGYPGGGLSAISASAVTIDAGQSYAVSVTTLAGTSGVSWRVACPQTVCGTVNTTSANAAIYTAPSGLTSSMTVALSAVIPNTSQSKTITITVNPDPTIVANLPAGKVGTPYTGTITVSGGTAPLSPTTMENSQLPPGLTWNPANNTITGTPTAAGTFTLTVQATDSSAVPYTVTAQETIVISASGSALTFISGNPANGTVGASYAYPLVAGGGTTPYAYSVTGGTLPPGLTLSNAGLISGTPTTAGTSMFTAQVKDASGATASGSFTLLINPASVTLTLTSPPNGTAGTPYTGTIGVTGGTGPYSCQITAGSLPAGLTLNGCVISGTTTVAGPVNLTVKATDSSSPIATVTGPVSFTIAPAGSALALTPPPAATVQTPYTGTIGVTGGKGPYTCMIPAGTLPPGLTNNSCVISGTPTTAGTTTVSVTATDSSNPTLTVTAPVAIVVNPLAALTFTGSLPNATVNVPYMQTLAASGGLSPYTYAVTAGTLPAGITVSPAGVVSGTPTAVGAYSFTVTATDSENPVKTASLPLVLVVQYATTPQDAALTGPYAFLFQGYDDALIGVLPYKTATIGSFTADGKGGITTGEQDENHQTSSPTGITVQTQSLIGTYSLGADYRGSLTVTRLKTDGTVGTTTTYAIAVKAPVSPATKSTSGSLIESDDNQLQGTKGSGSFLSQSSTAIAAGLTGSYVFGISGDTPCLVSCSVNLSSGPVAEVGQFAVTGGTLLGVADTNIAATNLANANLNGTYGTADTNGRLALSLTTVGQTATTYPTDYAVYVVDATHAYLMSTDKHSQYILLAGSMEQQAQSSFSNASMTGAFVGYENSATNPGLVGATLTQVASLSTATIFQGTDRGDGTCNINAVDTGGVNGLVSGLTGIVGNLTSLATLLGSYSATGATTCGVTSIGRGVLAYPPVFSLLGIQIGTPPAPRVFYLRSPNHGYFLETSYAGLGNLENQTGAPFTLSNTFTGTYVYESLPAASAASIDTSGVIVSNGAGSATSTLDTNIGVGTLNVIQLGTTQTNTYTAPDANGRITYGTDAIYAITPNRFVLLDTNILTTSPSVSLLY